MQKLNILEAGKGWVAVEKPSEISVHNDPGKDLRSILSDRIKNPTAPFTKVLVPVEVLIRESTASPKKRAG